MLAAGIATPAMAGPTGTTAWTPAQWSSTQNALWLDASASVLNSGSTAATNGQAAQYWKDLSGNNQDVQQLNTGSQAVWVANTGTNAFGNAMPALNFTQDFYQATGANTSYWKFMSDGSTQYTVFTVVKTGTNNNPLSTPNAAYGIFATGNGATTGTGMHVLYDDRSGTTNRFDRLTVQVADGASPVVTGTFQDNWWKPNQYQVADFTFNFTSSTSNPSLVAYQSGSAGLTSGVRGDTPNNGNPSNQLVVGALSPNSFALDGGFQELLIYKGAISGSERQLVEGYLAWKWGLENTLTSTSPYSTQNANYIVVVPEPVPVAMLGACGLAFLGVLNYGRRRTSKRRAAEGMQGRV